MPPAGRVLTRPVRPARRPTLWRTRVPAATHAEDVAAETILSAELAWLAPAVTADVTVGPAIQTLTLAWLAPEVTNGAVPRLRVTRVGPRYPVAVVATVDGWTR